MLERQLAFFGDRPPKVCQYGFAILRVQMPLPKVGRQPLVGWIAEDALGLTADKGRPKCGATCAPSDGAFNALDQLAITAVARHPQLGQGKLIFSPLVFAQQACLPLDLLPLPN